MKAIPTRWQQRAAVDCMFSVNGILLASWVPHIPLVQVRLGLDHAALGLALLGLALGAMVSMPLSGWLIGKVGNREVSWFSAVLSCFSAALPVMAPDFFTLLLALIIYGACQGAMDVAMNAQAVRVEKDWGQPIMSSFHGMYSAGGLLGAGLGGLYLNHFAPGWHMWLVAAVMLLAVGLTGRWLPEDGPQLVSDEEHKPRRILTPALLAIGVVAFVVMMTEGAMADWSAVYLSTAHNAGKGTAALGFAAFSLCMDIGRFSGDYLVRRGRRRTLLVVSALLAAFGLALAVMTSSLTLALIGFALVGLGLSNLIPVLFSTAGNMPNISAQAAVATIATFGYSGFLLGPPMIGLSAHWLGLATTLGLLALLVLVLAICAPWLVAQRQHSTPVALADS